VALASGVVYLLDIALFRPEQMGLPLFLQVLVFTGVASATSAIGGKLRQVRQELRGVSGELHRLKLDTADILASVPTAVITLDVDGRLAYMNPEASKLLSLDLPEWVGKPVLAELEKRSLDLGQAVRQTMDTGRRIRNREAVVLVQDQDSEADHQPETRRGGAEAVDPDDPSSGTAVAVSTTLLQGHDSPSSLVVLVQDLSTVRQIENLRLRTGKLEAVAELSASLAHELKNPLASIRSAVEQLCDRSWADADDQILGNLIVRESDRLDRILREFGDFARVDVVERQPIDVSRLVHDCVSVAKQHPAAAGRATFEVEIGEETDGLWGDPELLHATLSNLLLNAVQVGDQDRPVTVRVIADSLRPDLVPREASLRLPVRIRVMDDGPGISAEDRDRIFDPFYTKREGGSGLGLSIAYRAVQAHGGVLMVKSEEGHGATFDIVLPRRAAIRPPGLPGHPVPELDRAEDPVGAES
jgi:two-component system sensor histidine kinase PilS (NtrC family)